MVETGAMAFPQTVDILKLILGKAMGFSPSHFLKRYQTNHPIEAKIYKLIASSIPHLHCYVDIIIQAPLKKEYSEIILEIIKEGLENTAIHSQAARADVNLFVDHKKIKLFLQDDGQGFCIFSLTPEQQGLSATLAWRKIMPRSTKSPSPRWRCQMFES